MRKTMLKRTIIAGIIAEILIPTIVAAQSNAEAVKTETVTVSGIRASLSSAAQTKRLQEGVVDAVSAEDVGKFPDTNIAESLQRVTGVQIQRNNGEGRFISVRGLGPEFNNVLVNGRTMTSDTGGREFSFDLLSPDLISKTLVYKSSLASLPEGGIGSTVDVQTARPLSFKENKGVINVSNSYDSNSKKNTPNLTGMYSWANERRNFGILGSVSYTDRASKQNSAVNDKWLYRDVTLVNGNENSKGLTMADVTTKKLYVPQSFGFQQEIESRKRLVASTTLQYNPSDTWKITADALYSRLKQQNNVIAVSDWINPVLLNAKIDGNNQVTSFIRPGSTFYGNNPAIVGDGKAFTNANSNDMIAKGDDRTTITKAFGVNSKWQATPELKVEVDLSASKTTRESPDMWIVNGMVPKNSDFLNFGTSPSISFGDGLTDPTKVLAHVVSYGIVSGEDAIKEARLNFGWSKEIGAFKGIDAGLGYSTRKVNQTSYYTDAWDAFSGYHVALPASLFTVKSLDGVLGSGNTPSGYLSFDPFAYMNYLNQASLLPLTNDPAKYSNKTKYPNGVMGIDYTSPNYWEVEEKVTSLFLDSKWEGSGWSANAGVRMVRVDSQSSGYSRILLSAVKSPNDTTYILTFGDRTLNSVSNSYNSFLPSANIKFDLSPDTLLRLAVSKTETRPTLNQMGVNNSYGGRYGDVQTGGGNPYLKPMKSTNFDASYEWYINKTSYLSAAIFHKKVSDFLEKTLVDIKIPQYSEIVHDTRVRNGQSGKITGAELGGQYAFDNGPTWLQGFGVAANYTYVRASAERASGVVDCGYPGLSPQSYNAAAFYENSRFQARLSYNWRNDFAVNCGGGSTLKRTREAYGQADASLRYSLTNDIQLYADITNLTNAKTNEFALNSTQFLTLQDIGRRFSVGARFSF